MLEHRPSKFGKHGGVVVVNGRRDESLSGLLGEEIAKTLAERRARDKPNALAKRRLAAAIAEREEALKKARSRRVGI